MIVNSKKIFLCADDNRIYDNIIGHVSEFAELIKIKPENLVNALKNEQFLSVLIIDSVFAIAALKNKNSSLLLYRIGTIVNLTAMFLCVNEVHFRKPLYLLDFLKHIESIILSNSLFIDINNDFIFDEKNSEIRNNTKIISLTHKEKSVIRFLLMQEEYQASKQEIFFNVWGYNNKVETSTFDVHLIRLKKKLPHSMLTIKESSVKIEK